MAFSDSGSSRYANVRVDSRPLWRILFVALPSGLAFTLPVGTPGNAIAYSSGYMQLRDMLIPGSLLVLIAWAAFNLTAIYYWPMIGLSLTSR